MATGKKTNSWRKSSDRNQGWMKSWKETVEQGAQRRTGESWRPWRAESRDLPWSLSLSCRAAKHILQQVGQLSISTQRFQHTPVKKTKNRVVLFLSEPIEITRPWQTKSLKECASQLGMSWPNSFSYVWTQILSLTHGKSQPLHHRWCWHLFYANAWNWCVTCWPLRLQTNWISTPRSGRCCHQDHGPITLLFQDF